MTRARRRTRSRWARRRKLDRRQRSLFAHWDRLGTERMTATEFIVLVTGSRTWTDYGFIYRRLAELGAADREGQRIVVVHGDAPDGADPMADRAAKDLGYAVRPYPAHWEFGKDAGKSRNSFMLQTERPKVVLAFWKDSSPGTGDAIEKALDLGIYTEVHER